MVTARSARAWCEERPGLVLDVAGLRELRVLVLRLRDGIAGSGALAKDAR